MGKFLIDKIIYSIKIAGDKKAILFKCLDGDHMAKTDGDCCSSTWIETIEAPALGFPCKVIDVVDLDMPEQEQDDEYEVIAFYGCKISTDKGDIVIDYRNESNGYYGGNLSWPGDYFYGGVFNQNVSNEEWKDVDFS